MYSSATLNHTTSPTASGFRPGTFPCSFLCRSVLTVVLLITVQDQLQAEIDFDRHIGPLLTRRCVSCHHGPDAKAGLDLSSAAGLRAGGESGAAISSDAPNDSLLLQRVEAGDMPAAIQGQANPLPDAEVALLREWIVGGANWPDDRTLDVFAQTSAERAGRDWWSLQPLKPVTVPRPTDRTRITNPIDAFVVQTLQNHHRTLAPNADRKSLMRRAYYDLVGLPPSYSELEDFASDESPQAYEQMIDRLLASPHYGERWGRFWLDLVRYADTCGYERDQPKSNIWRYRDWVVQALNHDMPYDQFIAEQLAGDEVSWRSESTVIATGMLRAGTWNDEPNDPEDYLYERLEDMVHTTTSAFLGLTVKCARCHDHKFDPIAQTDYYRLASFFWSGYMGQANLGGPSKEELGYDVFGWTDRGRAVQPIHLLRSGQRLNPGDEIAPGFLSAIPQLDKPLKDPPPESRTTLRRLQFARWLTDPQNPLTARVMVNRLWQHHFGEAIVRTPNNFGLKSDPPTHPELLDWLAIEFMRNGWQIKPMHRLMMLSSTYRQASTHPDHSKLEQEDFTNRTWWHFPRRRLDAESLRDSLLVASGELQLEMGGPSFYPHMTDEALEGLSRKGGDWQESPAKEQARRSLYMINKRSRLLPMMTAFDFSDTTLTCAQRDVTTVAPQALAMLNNDFVHRQSRLMAERVAHTAGTSLDRQVEFAWQIALGRSPSHEEQTAAIEHLNQQAEHFLSNKSQEKAIASAAQLTTPQQLALASLCHVLLNTNEYLYID